MHGSNGLLHCRITQSKNPPRAILRMVAKMQPQRLNQHQIGQILNDQIDTRLLFL